MKPAKPNALDRAIAWFAPERGLRRALSRQVMAVASGYHGARRDRNGLREWGAAVGSSADYDTLWDLDVLRARSRDLIRNDPLAQSAVATKVAQVIGGGHVCRPEVDAAALRLTEAQAQEWEAQATQVWTEWSSSRDCDITRGQTFGEMEDLVYRSRLTSGDAFVLLRNRTRHGRLFTTCLQVLEADRVGNPNFQPDSDRLAGGVELDRDGAMVAVHVANRAALDRARAALRAWRRVPAYDADGWPIVLHQHGPRSRPELTRYVPMLAPVIEALKQRSRYSEAELMAAVVSACFAISMKSDDGSLGGGLETVANAALGAELSRQPLNITEPGAIVDLLPGEEIQAFAPGRPNPQFAPFIDAVAQEIGAGTDLPHELLVKRFQASYSASRAALELAWTFFRADRALHVAQFCRPVYSAVIAEAVARGLLIAPGFFTDPLARSAWLGADWLGPARPTLDPEKDARADRAYLDMGVTSVTRIAAERFGTDIETVRRRRAQDGSNLVPVQGAPAPAPANTNQGDSDDAG